MPYPQNSPDSTSIGFNFPAGQSNYDASVLTPNGKIYCPPCSITYVLIIDPSNNVIDTTTLTFNTFGIKYSSGNLAPNGKIYCAPEQETRVLIIDPVNNILDTTSVSIPGLNGVANKWHSSVTTDSGILYAMPRDDVGINY